MLSTIDLKPRTIYPQVAALLTTTYPGLPILDEVSRVLKCVVRHIHTAILFTWTDYKTIFIPVTTFGCATAPVQSMWHLAQGCMWIWLHLLLCNVSNQATSKAEDTVNRPWRPLPSGRVSDRQIKALRIAMIALCVGWSLAFYGTSMLLVTLGLVLTTFAYDEMAFASHPVGKNFCNIWGYVSFETAAVRIMGPGLSFDHISRAAVCCSGMLIFSTIQAQDFPDVTGDTAAGRITLPIYAPELSRILTLIALPTWSIGLSRYWCVGPAITTIITLVGCFVGARYYKLRDPSSDKQSYIMFNIWLVAVSLLPLQARFGILNL